jgi:hypothetical protein
MELDRQHLYPALLWVGGVPEVTWCVPGDAVSERREAHCFAS